MIVRARAPLRLGIAGGGTDVSPYCDEYGGYVLNATIGMYAYAMLEPAEDGVVSFDARDYHQSVLLRVGEVDDFDAADSKLALHAGVYRRIVRDFLGGRPLAVRLTTYADAAAGSGLGTSSTLVVAMVKAFVEYLNLPLGEYEIASLAYAIERSDVGLCGGKQDQYAATFGGFNFMEFYDGDRVIVNPLRIKNWIISELEASLLLFYTGVSRESAAIIAEQRTNVLAGDSGAIEAMHEVKREAQVVKEALLKGDFTTLANSLRTSWESKKRMARNISNEHIDHVFEVALEAGAKAGKISGAGGGGFVMFMVDPPRRIDVIHALHGCGGQAKECHFTKYGTQGWRIG